MSDTPKRTTTIILASVESGGYREADISTPMKAIRPKCLDCSGGSADNVKHCTISDCPLYPMRSGKNPFRKPRQLTEEQRQVMANRLRHAREARIVQK